MGEGLSYQGKYAMLGAIAFKEVAVLDGINEKGLSIGTFYFPECAGYSSTTEDNQEVSLSAVEFPNWILSQFANTQEVMDALAAGEVVISDVPVEGWGPVAPPFHYIVFDRSGGCIVIEPMDGQLIVYENPLGVLTNSPSFDWQMVNLCNYNNLSFYSAMPRNIQGLIFPNLSQGSGLVGLPGDYTATSRFVRAVLFTQAAPMPDTIEDAIPQLFHLFNAFDIPYGASQNKTASGNVIDYTQVTAVRDPVRLRYFIRTYDDQTISVINLREFDPNAREVKKLAIQGNKQRYLNIQVTT